MDLVKSNPHRSKFQHAPFPRNRLKNPRIPFNFPRYIVPGYHRTTILYYITVVAGSWINPCTRDDPSGMRYLVAESTKKRFLIFVLIGLSAMVGVISLSPPAFGQAVPALSEIRRQAESGMVNAQVLLGDMYSRGNGVARDNAEAARWYRMAGDQGHAGAQNNLAGCTMRAAAFRLISWKRRAGIVRRRTRATRARRITSASCTAVVSGCRRTHHWRYAGTVCPPPRISPPASTTWP